MPKMDEARINARIETASNKRKEIEGKGTPEERRAARKHDKRARRKLKNRVQTQDSAARQQRQAAEKKASG